MKLLLRLLLALIVLLVIAGVVAATCPADYAYRFVADRLGAVHLAGLSGSIWQGHANSTQLFGQELGAVDWSLDAAPLLSGDVLAHINLSGGDIAASGVVGCHTDGTVDVHDAVFQLPARLAAPALDIPALQLLGTIEGKLDHARMRGAWLDDAGGSVRWRNAAVAGAAQAQLGDLEATFSSTPNGAIAGVAHDLGGPLQLNGTFKIAVDSFDADATLAARDGNAQVAEALRYIGEPQADGSSHLLIHGTLFKLF